MQSIFNQIPFIRFFLPFVLGILINVGFDLNQESTLLLIGIYACVLIVFFAIRYRSVPYKKLLYGLLINFFFFVLGSEISFLFRAQNNPSHYSHQLSFEPDYVLAFVSDIPQQKEKTVKTEVSLLSLRVDGHWKNTQGKALCYIQKDSAAQQLAYGNLIVFPNSFQEIKGPMNPGEFDYKGYLSRKNIFHQAYLPTHSWRNSGEYENNFLYSFSYKLKSRLLAILEENGLKDEKLAVVSALLLGYGADIDPELLNAYAHTGTLHVLSVSGLHVGVIYMVLNFLFGFLNKNSRTKLVKCLIVLSFLWFYSLLSGLSPSVVRAASMFSMMLIGTTFKRKSGVYNVILVTAFFILLYNPLLLFDTGFQLSYLAVFGIVYFYPRIYQLIDTDHYLLDKVWALSAVSIAAQIATLPISLYYFHQFPTYFLISNLIIIPISTIVMYLGILVLCLSPFAAVCSFFTLLLSFMVGLMNKLTFFFDSWPLSFIPNISVSFTQMILLYVVLILLSLAVDQKSYRLLSYSICTAMIVVAISLFNDINQKQRSELVVYQLDKNSCMEIFHGSSSVHIRPENKMAPAAFQLSGNKVEHGTTKTDTFKIQEGIVKIECGNKSIVVLNTSKNLRDDAFYFDRTEAVVWTANSKLSAAKAKALFHANEFIADGSNSAKTINRIKKEIPELKTSVHFTKESGARIIAL